jgi:iron complex transport system substrate-binding protein
MAVGAGFGGCVPAAPLYGGAPAAVLDQTQASAAAPTRIVSLDYCADQYVLKLAARENIRALSPDAGKAFSFMREAAKGLPVVRANAEDVILLKPDLVVRSYGGGAGAQAFFERAGIEVLNLGWAGNLEDINALTRHMAKGLGAAAVGEAMIADMDKRLAAILDVAPAASARPNALYMTPSGVTSGAGSIVHDIIETAGYENFMQKSGWHSLPLERLAYERPDAVIAAFFDSQSLQTGQWSAMRHPIALAQINGQSTHQIAGALMSCSGWWMVEAAEKLAKANIADRKNQNAVEAPNK